MYNDEHNLYHYTYRKDGSEAEAHPAPQPGPVQDHNSGPQQPVQEMKPVKKNRIGLKVTALALCCALLGGAVGGGIVWGVGRSGDETSVNVSGRTVSQVALKTVDGKTAMSDAEVYAANVNSVVSINVTGDQQQQLLRSAGTNGILRLRLLFSPRMAILSPTTMWWRMPRP